MQIMTQKFIPFSFLLNFTHNERLISFGLKKSIILFFFLTPFILFSSLSFSIEKEAPNPSDIYCQHLQEMQARTLREKKEPSPIELLFNFVNSLTKKISLEDIEKQALEKKMSFEEFQKWANETHSLSIKDHFKAQYLQDYIKLVCGEITFSATFSDTPEPDMSAKAEKKFDPKGHPYAEEIFKNKK